MELVFLVLAVALGFGIGDMYRYAKVMKMFKVKSRNELKKLASKKLPG